MSGEVPQKALSLPAGIYYYFKNGSYLKFSYDIFWSCFPLSQLLWDPPFQLHFVCLPFLSSWMAGILDPLHYPFICEMHNHTLIFLTKLFFPPEQLFFPYLCLNIRTPHACKASPATGTAGQTLPCSMKRSNSLCKLEDSWAVLTHFCICGFFIYLKYRLPHFILKITLWVSVALLLLGDWWMKSNCLPYIWALHPESLTVRRIVHPRQWSYSGPMWQLGELRKRDIEDLVSIHGANE